MLQVDPSGARRWILRLVVRGTGQRRNVGLGAYPIVSLKDAKAKAAELRAGSRSGIDPLASRRHAAGVVPTFEQAARLFIESNKPNWSNAKHAAQWSSTLQTYAYPIIGAMLVSDLTRADVIKTLKPIWIAKQETASRVRQRLHAVMDWAIAHEHRATANPVDSALDDALPAQKGKVRHHPALPFKKMPAFMAWLREACPADRITRLALEFTILTAARSGEVRFAEWSEIDLEAKLWAVPAERMKARNAHVVPLSGRAIEVLKAAASQTGRTEGLVFRTRLGKSLSDMTLTQLLRRSDWRDAAGNTITAHGFRSTFRDWASECTSNQREVVEMALAHAIGSAVEAAYRRGNLLQKRTLLMAEWANYVDPHAVSNVVPLHQAAG